MLLTKPCTSFILSPMFACCGNFPFDLLLEEVGLFLQHFLCFCESLNCFLWGWSFVARLAKQLSKETHLCSLICTAP